MPRRKKAGTIEIEVAANREKFDRDMADIRQRTEQTERQASSRMERLGKAVRNVQVIAGAAELAIAAVAIAIANKQRVIELSTRAWERFSTAATKASSALRAGIEVGVVRVSGLLEGMGRRLQPVLHIFGLVQRQLGRVAAVGVERVGRAIQGMAPAARIALTAVRGLAIQMRVLSDLATGGLFSRALGAVAMGTARAFNALGAATSLMGERMRGFFTFMGRTGLASLSRVSTFVGKITNAFVSWAEIGLKTAGAGLEKMGRELAETGRGFAAINATLIGTGRTLRRLGRLAEAVGKILFGLKASIALTAGAFAIAAKNAADDFVPTFNRVRTLLPDLIRDSRAIRDEVQAIGAEFGLSSEVINNTFYQILSAMPDVVSEPEVALNVLRVTAGAVATGFTDGETAARALGGVLTAFKKPVTEAEKVLSQLFATQNRGVTTIGELAGEMGRLAPLASQMGVSFEELLGLMALLTREGRDTGEAATSLAGILAGIARPTERAKETIDELGLSFGVAATQSEGLIPLLIQVREQIERSGKQVGDVLPQLFEERAAFGGLLTVLNNLEALEDDMTAVGGAAEELQDILAIMFEDSAKQSARFGEEFKRSLRGVGFDLEQLKTDFVGALADMLKDFNDFNDKADQGWRELVQIIRRVLPLVEETDDEITNVVQEMVDLAQDAGEQVRDHFKNFLIEFRDFVAGLHAEVEITLADPIPFARPLLPGSFEDMGFTDEDVENMKEEAARTGSTFGRVMHERMVRAFNEGTEEGLTLRQDKVIPELLKNITGQIAERRLAAQRRALQVFLETDDFDTYQRALRDAQKGINSFVLAQVNMLEKAGASREILDEVIQGFVVLGPQLTDKEKKVKALREELDLMDQFGFEGMFEDLPSEVQQALREMKVLEEERKALLAVPAGERDDSFTEILENNARAIVELSEKIRRLSEDEVLFLTAEEQKIRELTEQIRTAAGLGFEDLADVPTEFLPQLDALGRLRKQIEDMGRLIKQLPEDSEFRSVGEQMMALWRGQAEEIERILKRAPELRNALKAFGASTLDTLSKLAGERGFEQFGAQLEKLAVSQAEFVAAKEELALVEANEKKTSDQVTASKTKLKTATEALNAVLAESIILFLEHQGAMDPELAEALRAALKGVAENADQSASSAEKFFKAFSTAAAITRGIMSIAGAFGVLDDQLQLVLGSLVNVAEGAARFAAGDFIGGGVQALGGLVGLIGGLFGKSPEEKAREEALRNNTHALMNLADIMDEFANIVKRFTGRELAGLFGIKEEIDKVFSEVLRRRLERGDQGGGGFFGFLGNFFSAPFRFISGLFKDKSIPIGPGALAEGETLDFTPEALRELLESGLSKEEFQLLGTALGNISAALREAGVNMNELREVAEAAGLDFDAFAELIEKARTEGKLSKDEVEELIEAYGQLGEALDLLNFEEAFNNFTDQMELVRLELDLFDLTEPIDELKKMREVFLAFSGLSDELKKQFAAFDLTTEEGRTQAEEFIQRLFELSKTPEILELLGDLTLPEFQAFLRDFESTLDTLQEEEGDLGAQTEFGQFRGFTEISANRILGALSTSNFFLSDMAANIRILVTQGGGTPAGAPLPVLVAPQSAQDFAGAVPVWVMGAAPGVFTGIGSLEPVAAPTVASAAAPAPGPTSVDGSVHVGTVELPNVTDAQTFIDELRRMATVEGLRADQLMGVELARRRRSLGIRSP